MFILKMTIFILGFAFIVSAFSSPLDEINLLINAGRYERASKVIEKEIEKNNYSVNLLQNRIYVNARLENCGVVIDSMDMLKNKFGMIIKKGSSVYDVYTIDLELSAICAMHLKEYKKAEPYMNEAIPRMHKDDENLNRFRYWLANLCLMSKDYDCSREQFLRFYPNSCKGKITGKMIHMCENTEYNMAILEDKIGEKKRSIKWARHLLNTTKDKKNWHDMMIHDPDYVNILKSLR